MAYDLAKVTANGNNLIAQILANKSSLSIDKIEISDTQLPSTTDISTMTSVPKVVQTVSANGFSKNSNTLIISTVVDNSSIRADYKAWVFGIWGSDSQNGQSQLIAVITSTNSPDTIPAFSGSTPVSYTYKFNIGFSNASQIQFNMIDDSFATNDTVVHTTGDETIDGQKKFDTDPTDGAGNAYAKTVDVNQQLDKKVNVADMRKPASDVAGIEEVNVKQDKIGYTPADDSKVVHDNHDGTEQLNGVQVQPFNKLSDTIGGRNLLINTAQLNDSTVCLDNKSNVSDTYLGLNIYQVNTAWDEVRIFWSYLAPKLKTNTNYVMSEYVRNTSPTKSADIGIFGNSSGVVFNSPIDCIITKLPPNSGWTRISAPINIASFPTKISGVLGFENETTLTDGYVQFAGYDFRRGTIPTSDWTPAPEDKVNVSDMRKPASDVAGIEEVNAKQDKIAYTPADDSKVAHLSGANNFDTVPTVNNNPLLLASSLPSDLARTGQSQTFTQPQTFSIAPVINDASKDKGDNQAATMADLKSVENSAWIQLDVTNVNDEVALCRVDGNKLWVVWGVKRQRDSSANISYNYSLGKVPQSIQGKKFSEFNEIFHGEFGQTLNYTNILSISSNSVMASYTAYSESIGYSIYGYFTFN